MPGGSEWIFILTFLLLVIYYFTRKGTKQKLAEQNNSDSKGNMVLPKHVEIKIPDTCPHCKNPNTKKIRLCEWCGNQII